MFALLAVAVVTAAGIVVPSGNAATCPSADQVKFALRARLPDVLGEGGEGVAAPLLLQWSGSAQSLEVQLRDARDVVVLSRMLRLQSAAEADCVALAETVALIIERYLDDLQELAALAPASATPPPPAEPPPAWASAMRVLGHSGRQAWLPPGGELSIERGRVRKGWRGTLGGVAGVIGSGTEASEAGRLERLNTWLLLRAGLWRDFGMHRLGVVADAGAAAVRAKRQHSGITQSAWGVEPWLGVGLRYRVVFWGPLFVEASAGVYTALVRHELVVRLPEDGRQVVAATPRIFTDLGLGAGVQF